MPWAHLAAPVGRRSVGFDWEDWGRVDVIDTTLRGVVNEIPVPVLKPRGVAVIGDQAYVTPFLSGNNTATKAVPIAVPPRRKRKTSAFWWSDMPDALLTSQLVTSHR